MPATWTSFDMPLQLKRGTTITSNFVYGPEHQRTKQTRSDSTTIIYAGAQEVETKTGVGTTVKTYWPYGVGVEIDRPTTGLEMNWVHVDRLGSPVAISDASGNLKEKLAYDAWGKRRTIDGAPISLGGNLSATPGSIDGVTDNRGFTGHEMLDTLDLVHMNGRVYDPFLAHFLSADPLVQDPMNGQSYNRYSYVLNNPTNLTDPTGFECEGRGLSLCGFTSFFSSVQQSALETFEKLSPSSQKSVMNLVDQPKAKNMNPNPAVPGCVGPCRQKEESTGATIGPVPSNAFKDNFIGRMVADVVGKPIALFTANNENPLTNDIENFAGDRRAEAAIGILALGIGRGARAGKIGAEETVSLFRKMSAAEADATLNAMKLQPSIPGSNGSKYLSESLSKVENFQNAGVSAGTREKTLEFILNRKGYDSLMNSSVNQSGSRGIDAVKYNFEGINSGSGLRNIGVPHSQLDLFNSLIINIK